MNDRDRTIEEQRKTIDHMWRQLEAARKAIYVAFAFGFIFGWAMGHGW